jgi:hypothetical protein
MPFDLALLADETQFGRPPLARPYAVASGFPLMTRGWPAFVGPQLLGARRRFPRPPSRSPSQLLSQLTPTPWTTFTILDPGIQSFLLTATR